MSMLETNIDAILSFKLMPYTLGCFFFLGVSSSIAIKYQTCEVNRHSMVPLESPAFLMSWSSFRSMRGEERGGESFSGVESQTCMSALPLTHGWSYGSD